MQRPPLVTALEIVTPMVLHRQCSSLHSTEQEVTHHHPLHSSHCQDISAGLHLPLLSVGLARLAVSTETVVACSWAG